MKFLAPASQGRRAHEESISAGAATLHLSSPLPSSLCSGSFFLPFPPLLSLRLPVLASQCLQPSFSLILVLFPPPLSFCICHHGGPFRGLWVSQSCQGRAALMEAQVSLRGMRPIF